MLLARNILVLALTALLPLAASAAPPSGPVEDAPRPPREESPPTPLLDLGTALQWTLEHNPGLVTVRQNLDVSAEAVEVARRFPTNLNPTVAVDVRPWVFERGPSGEVHRLDSFVSVSWAQPIELGGRRALRADAAQASYCQTRWNILQAELTALVQTYRLHQAATYRRQRQDVAQRLVEFNARLLESLRRQAEANQAPASDVVMAEVESQATVQQLETARQEYVAALTELRQQLGMPEQAATAEPSGPLRIPPADLPGGEEALVELALSSRPEVQAACSQLSASRAAVSLARADRIPVPSVGPVYERNETGASFYGITASSPIPVLNAGATLVRQREAEYRRDRVALEQTRQQVTTQVKAVLVKWRHVQQSALRTRAQYESIATQAQRMQRLYTAGQADLIKLLQVRGRLIEAENTQLDATWQTIQAHADLLTAVGATPLLGVLSQEPTVAPASLSGKGLGGG